MREDARGVGRPRRRRGRALRPDRRRRAGADLRVLPPGARPRRSGAAHAPVGVRADLAEITAAFLVPKPPWRSGWSGPSARSATPASPFRCRPRTRSPSGCPGSCRVVYLMFTEGTGPRSGYRLIRPELCDQAIAWPAPWPPCSRQARRPPPGAAATGRRPPGRPGRRGRRPRPARRPGPARVGPGPDRRGRRPGRAGPARQQAGQQIQAAIAACHSTAPTADVTDWAKIAACTSWPPRADRRGRGEDRAVAVAMAEGRRRPRHARRPRHPPSRPRELGRRLHVARAGLLGRLGRLGDAADAYERALALGPPPTERAFIAGRLRRRGRRLRDRRRRPRRSRRVAARPARAGRSPGTGRPGRSAPGRARRGRPGRTAAARPPGGAGAGVRVVSTRPR